MTMAEFLQVLREVPSEWAFTSVGALRVKGEPAQAYCPIIAVCGHMTGDYMKPYLHRFAGSKIGLSSVDIERISNAADNSANNFDPEFRKQLFEAVGLA